MMNTSIILKLALRNIRRPNNDHTPALKIGVSLVSGVTVASTALHYNLSRVFLVEISS